jgi:outer membrane protein assembly factor BamC
LLFSLLLTGLLAGCGGNILPESKKIEYKSAGKAAAARDSSRPDPAEPRRALRGSRRFIKQGFRHLFRLLERAFRPGTNHDGAGSAAAGRQDAHRAFRYPALAGRRRSSPDKLWPGVKEFWQELGFLVNVESSGSRDHGDRLGREPGQDSAGRHSRYLGKVFDSLYSTAERDKFRTRLEKGAEPGTVEIYISHRGMYEIIPTKAGAIPSGSRARQIPNSKPRCCAG